MINLFVGYDPRESIVYHTFCQSVMEHASVPVAFIPLHLPMLKSSYSENHTDGSNDFIYSRFLVPFLSGYSGISIFCDGDMILKEDIVELVALAERGDKAVWVAQHDYKTKFTKKYLGNKNEDYPRKNWSSVIVWNGEHPKHRILTPELVAQSTGPYLHRFSWLDDEDIGSLPLNWNWLVLEYEKNPSAKLLHYTVGSPNFKEFSESDNSSDWFESFSKVIQGLEK